MKAVEHVLKKHQLKMDKGELILKHIETLSRNWVTRQVDFTNAFAQGTLSEIVFIESPKGFSGKDGTNKVLRLIKSLYGLKQSAKTFYEMVKEGLLRSMSTQDGTVYRAHLPSAHIN